MYCRMLHHQKMLLHVSIEIIDYKYVPELFYYSEPTDE